MRTIDRVFAFTLASSLACVSGCAASAEGNGDTERTSATSSATTYGAGSNYEDFTWRQGDGAYFLRDTTNYFCSLIAVAGSFRGTDEVVSLDQYGGYWLLSGKSKQSGIAATARCVPWSQFNSWHWVTGATTAQSTPGCGAYACPQPPYPATQLLETNYLEYCFLTSLAGELDGWGEDVAIDLPGRWWNGGSLAGGGGSGLELYTRHGGSQTVQASARCVEMAQFGSVRFYAYGALTDTPTPMTWLQGSGPTWLAPVASASCFLVGVGGDFRGSMEQVQINEMYGWWTLSGESSHDNVRAEAMCVAYDQRR